MGKVANVVIESLLVILMTAGGLSLGQHALKAIQKAAIEKISVGLRPMAPFAEKLTCSP